MSQIFGDSKSNFRLFTEDRIIGVHKIEIEWEIEAKNEEMKTIFDSTSLRKLRFAYIGTHVLFPTVPLLFLSEFVKNIVTCG